MTNEVPTWGVTKLERVYPSGYSEMPGLRVRSVPSERTFKILRQAKPGEIHPTGFKVPERCDHLFWCDEQMMPHPVEVLLCIDGWRIASMVEFYKEV